MKSILRLALPFALVSLVAVAQLEQKTNKENMVHDRGRTIVQPPGENPDYGRIGTQASVPSGPVTVHGMLIDGSCMNRTNANVYRTPEPLPARVPPANTMQAPSTGASSANGISVEEQTLANERGDIMPHQVPDMVSRQPDRTCAITASTKHYSLMLPNGRLIDLDYGGDTLANELVFATPQGQAMMNGTGPGLKLPVQITGRVIGDRVVVNQLTR